MYAARKSGGLSPPSPPPNILVLRAWYILHISMIKYMLTEIEIAKFNFWSSY